jgi:ABC-type transport system involved in cytochrome bd biosynthesis fused ATPase/permease subunit
MLLRAFARRRPALLAILCLCAAGIGLCEGAFVLAAKAAVAGPPGRTWLATLAMLAAIVTARALIAMSAAGLEARGTHAWLAERRSALLNAAAGRAFPAYRDPWRNTLVTALGSGSDDLANGLGAGFRCLAALAHTLVLVPALFFFGWRPAAAALLLAVPAWLGGRWKSRRLGAAAEGLNRARLGLTAELEAFAEGLESEAGNGRLGGAASRLGEGLEAHAARARAWEMARALFPPVLEWICFMALAALAWVAGELGPAAGPEGLLPFGALLILLYRPIREWARHHPAYALGKRASADLVNLQVTLEGFPRRRPRPAAPGGGVAVESLAFGYGPAPVFYGLGLRLEAAELTWITGRNGTGKSTLLKLIAGIEEPSGGRILGPGGAAPCAYLPQRAYVEPDYAAWARAFRAAHPDEWRELDGILGLERLLAKAGWEDGAAPGASAREGGRVPGLSGGERQRLCLARVFASRAAYLLLDEPTTWLTAGDRERILGDLLAFWRRPRPDGSYRGGALVSHEPFLGEFCARTLHLDALRAGVPA